MFGTDITGPLTCTNKGNKYIIVAIDYGAKWCKILQPKLKQILLLK